MLTPQEVSSKTFPKAVMGGYGMAAVDEFLDKLTEDYTSLFKENAALKNKVKQLNDKIEEYRKVDETMRATLLAAQKMADEMVAQAEAKRDAALREVEEKRSELMGDAEEMAKKRMEELQRQVKAEEDRLAARRAEVDADIAGEEYRLEKTRRAVAKFMEIARGNCQEQLKILQRLEEMVPPPPPKAEEETPAEEPEAPILQAAVAPPEEASVGEEEFPTDDDILPEGDEDQGEVVDDTFFTSPLPSLSHLKNRLHHSRREEPRRAARSDETRRLETVDEAAVEESIRSAVEQLKVEQESQPYHADVDDEATRIINLDDLQFGRNYKRDN